MTMLDIVPPAWMREAICSSTDPALFFPSKGSSTAGARAVCAACPVTAKCLEWALKLEAENGRMPGVYGGLTVAQRKRLTADHICRAVACLQAVAGRGYRYCAPHSEQRKSATSHGRVA